ncbi:Kinesin- protein 12 [Dinochytrium kinnereticum]|nr:Kinesin- protein 12 [Dinochytrium kinnereticum]
MLKCVAQNLTSLNALMEYFPQLQHQLAGASHINFQQYPQTTQQNGRMSVASQLTGPLPPTPGPPSGVRVVVRVRPRNEMEAQKDESPAIECQQDCRTILIRCGDMDVRGLTFNKVCPQESKQEDVFEECKVPEMIMQALEGYSATIFAFGQTGSGKTFTITGPESEAGWDNESDKAGIIPRALQYLYQVIQQKTDEAIECKVSAAYLEIYNEHVQDLLNPNGVSLPIRWNSSRGFYVENLFIVECESLGDCTAVLEEGLRNRKTGSHNLNEHSSRSHSIMTIYVTTKAVDLDDGKPIVKHGRISFVDLAGSEKVKTSKATGETLNETLNINKSLLTLGNCISCLADTRRREGHIPYRDSKLTMLLSDSLGGHGIALMIACISPSTLNIHETIKTLRYAQRAKKIRNKPILLVDPVLDVVVQLKREVKGLRKENAVLRARMESRQQSGGAGMRLPAMPTPPNLGAMQNLNQYQQLPYIIGSPAPQPAHMIPHPPSTLPPQQMTPHPPSSLQPPSMLPSFLAWIVFIGHFVAGAYLGYNAYINADTLERFEAPCLGRIASNWVDNE